MHIVIDLPDEVYELLKYFGPVLDPDYKKEDDVRITLTKAVLRGTPLPKGHGRLIDADELDELFGQECVGDCGACMPKRKTDGRGRWYDTCSLIDVAPTIIEADTESEDKA